MNIAIDARWIFPKISGIGAYTRSLIRALHQLDHSHSFTLYFDNANVAKDVTAFTDIGNDPRFRTALLPYGVFSPKSQMALPQQLRKDDIDIFHSTNFMIPLLAFPRSGKGRTRCVTTIHDVIPMVFRDHAPRSKKAQFYPLYAALMREVGRRSATIITDSHCSQSDIIHHLKIAQDQTQKIKVIPCGIDPGFVPRKELPSHPNGARQLLYVGRFDPYKNVTGLVRAFSDARHALPFPLELVLAGAPDERYPEAIALARELGVADHIRWTGYLSDEEMITTFHQADLLVHPSRYEGFGLQIAEAMSCGVPVISSNAASLPEVAGDAAILVDPDDIKGMGEAICTLLQDPELYAAQTERGLKQAASFSWERNARETLRIYEELER